MRLRFRSFRLIWSKSRFLKSQSKKNDDGFRFARIANNHQTLQKWKTKRMKLKFHFIPCLVSSLQKRKERKERKDCQVHFHPSTNNFHSFSLIQFHQTNHSQSQSNHDENEKRKRWKWTSSTTIDQIETPSFNARVKRGWINKLHSPNYPLFQHSVSAMNTRSPPMRIDTPQVIRADRDLSHWGCRRLYPIQQSNEWVWRAWQEEVSN